MSNSGLVFQADDSHAAHGFYHQEIELISVGTAAGEGDRFAPVHRQPFGVRLYESRVAGLLGPACDLVDRLVPRDVLPAIGAGTPHLRLQYPPLVLNVLLQRRTLGTERTAVDWVIGIAFHVDDLRRDVLRLVADGVDDDAATHRAIGAGAARLRGTRNLQAPGLRQQGPRIEAENGNPDGACNASLEECSSRYIHYAALHDERLETVNRYRDGTEALGKRKGEAAIKVYAV